MAGDDCVHGIRPFLGAYVGLGIQIYIVTLHWWLTPIILNIDRSIPDITGKISWSCVVASAPGSAGWFAIRHAETPDERMLLYFDGMPVHGSKRNEIGKTPFKTIIFGLCSSALTIYSAIQLALLSFNCGTDTYNLDIYLQQLQFYPTLPSGIIGLWIILDGMLFKLSKRWSTFGCYSSLVGVFVALGTVTIQIGGTKISGYYGAPNIAYAAMSVPFIRDKGLGPLLMVIYSPPARCGAIAAGSILRKLVIEQLNHVWFTTLLIIFAVICPFLALWGIFRAGGPFEKREEMASVNRLQQQPTTTNELDIEEPQLCYSNIIVNTK